jgi:phosphotransferase system enzyme I (PtsI)
MDVSLRIMTALRGSVRDLPRFDQPCIALAPEFSPYQIAMLAKANVLGIATIRGGAASHAAILSRALGIPSVLAVGDSLRVIRDGEELLLDGSAGEITLSPTPDRVAAYESRERLVRGQSHEECDDRPAVTRDGHRIKVLANVSTMNDVEAARACGAEGVGLLRTELLFLGRKTAPPVDEQCAVYSHAARLFPEEGVVVRALDLGGDKALPFIQDHPGLNPLLGVRGIRLLLKNEELFRAQITSILMASTSGKVAMMVPFVTTVEEVERARELLLDESQRLSAPIEFGIMIETPSAALEARRLARLCDFFSIGTNDLVQHTMASDRTNAELSTLLRADSPAVLRLINEVISSAHVAGIRVSVCGESAYSDKVAPLLIGLGVDELSVPPAMVRRTKEIVRMTDRMEAAREALSLLR